MQSQNTAGRMRGITLKISKTLSAFLVLEKSETYGWYPMKSVILVLIITFALLQGDKLVIKMEQDCYMCIPVTLHKK